MTTGNATSPRLDLVFPGTELALRDALKKAMTFLRGLDLGQDACGLVELVLAEAVNNIIEHAYTGTGDGIVECRLRKDGELLHFCILDDGLPMPTGAVPEKKQQDLNGDLQDLPEGGFGWFLIHELTENLHYTRAGNRNRLEFTMRPSALPQ